MMRHFIFILIIILTHLSCAGLSDKELIEQSSDYFDPDRGVVKPRNTSTLSARELIEQSADNFNPNQANNVVADETPISNSYQQRRIKQRKKDHEVPEERRRLLQEQKQKAFDDARIEAVGKDARNKASRGAQLKATREARISAEEELRIKTEAKAEVVAELRTKAEEEAKIKAEAKAEAIEAARIKVEGETRIKALAKMEAEEVEMARTVRSKKGRLVTRNEETKKRTPYIALNYGYSASANLSNFIRSHSISDTAVWGASLGISSTRNIDLELEVNHKMKYQYENNVSKMLYTQYFDNTTVFANAN